MTISREQIENQLKTLRVPYVEQDLFSAKIIKSISIIDKKIHIALQLKFPCQSIHDELIQLIKQTLITITENFLIEIEITTTIETHVGQKNLKSIPHIKNIIAIASGKGGVGKSTTAVNLALALQAEGARIGILDADIYGPSQPMMLGISGKPLVQNKKISPMMAHGIQSMSIGYLVENNSAMVWRGPMVSMALQQLLNDTLWDNLDYLIIDLPPGTGDIQLTLAQKIPVSAAVIVTTPQDLALLDARRAYAMFQKVNVPVLGIIENMSSHICSQCGHTESIFGEGGGERLANESNLELLGSLPLNKKIREQTDSGKPPMIMDPESEIAKIYRKIACNIAAKLSLQAKDYSGKFPTIVVEQ
jgi:ATP-binding protein involved in chromosome partitioning